ncbi:hypothetical protein WH47_04062 [Habropoda laboriosa]|uniref:DUF4817 domain-containing protein n=1 Tax=Habropoda laboriosa TaxID=597456 RepID=A0A0L7QUP9_9HYME|nr:hypothetical protein WH47_04062 [Habropoda laboriosa]
MCNRTPGEIFDMISILGECLQSYRVAARLYRERFPDCLHLNRLTIRDSALRARQGNMQR